MRNVHGLIITVKVPNKGYEEIDLVPITREEANELFKKFKIKPLEIIGDIRVIKLKDGLKNDMEAIIEYGSFPGHPDVAQWWSTKDGALDAAGTVRFDKFSRGEFLDGLFDGISCTIYLIRKKKNS